MAFREGGKSTMAEEALILGAEFGLFHNAVIVGNTEKRACERLTAIKYELETNEFLAGLFGGPHDEHTSKVWNEAEIVLSNNVRITALGRGQSLRGTKYLQWRPDFCFCDDVEEVEKGQVYTERRLKKQKDGSLRFLFQLSTKMPEFGLMLLLFRAPHFRSFSQKTKIGRPAFTRSST